MLNSAGAPEEAPAEHVTVANQQTPSRYARVAPEKLFVGEPFNSPYCIASWICQAGGDVGKSLTSIFRLTESLPLEPSLFISLRQPKTASCVDDRPSKFPPALADNNPSERLAVISAYALAASVPARSSDTACDIR